MIHIPLVLAVVTDPMVVMVHTAPMVLMGHVVLADMVHTAVTAPMVLMGHAALVVVLAPQALLMKSRSLLNLMTETTI